MRKSKENSIDIKIAEDRLKDLEDDKGTVQKKHEFLKEMKDWVNK